MTQAGSLKLEVRRFIRASPDRIFNAWTTSSELLSWWGPKGVRCAVAEVDLRVGGSFRIGNELPDKSLLMIEGEFLSIERPRELVYTWRLGRSDGDPERVTVSFEGRPGGTEVIVVHERIADEPARALHAEGWEGCLDGLVALLET